MNVIVSGGSRGLGLELCEHLLASGHNVGSFARSETDAVRALRERHGDAYTFGSVDLSDDKAVSELVSSLASRWGSIDGLVNNAAVGQDSLFVHTSPERIREIIRINVEGPILLTRLVVRRMMRQDHIGQIVNIGSIGASRGYAGLTVYAATKGALESFTRTLAREIEGRVCINTIAPGFFDSEMSNVLLPEQRDVIVRRTPTGTLTTTDDLLKVVDLLLDGATNLNGAVIPVDGGASA